MVLSTINQYPNAEYAGLVVGNDQPNDVETYINNAPATAGVYDLVFTAVNNATYTATIYGVMLSYLADASATLAEIRDGIQALFALQPGLVLRATAVDSGNNLRITELDPTLYGHSTITGLDANTVLSSVTPHSNPETVEAGIVVARGPGFQDLRLIRQSTLSLVTGVTIHQHMPVSAYTSALRAGFPPFSEISVLKYGKIWMKTEEAIALTDTPYVRFAAGAGGTVLGRIRKSADTASAFDASSFLKFKTAQATPGGIVLVQVNVQP